MGYLCRSVDLSSHERRHASSTLQQSCGNCQQARRLYCRLTPIQAPEQPGFIPYSTAFHALHRCSLKQQLESIKALDAILCMLTLKEGDESHTVIWNQITHLTVFATLYNTAERMPAGSCVSWGPAMRVRTKQCAAVAALSLPLITCCRRPDSACVYTALSQIPVLCPKAPSKSLHSTLLILTTMPTMAA